MTGHDRAHRPADRQPDAAAKTRTRSYFVGGHVLSPDPTFRIRAARASEFPLGFRFHFRSNFVTTRHDLRNRMSGMVETALVGVIAAALFCWVCVHVWTVPYRRGTRPFHLRCGTGMPAAAGPVDPRPLIEPRSPDRFDLEREQIAPDVERISFYPGHQGEHPADAKPFATATIQTLQQRADGSVFRVTEQNGKAYPYGEDSYCALYSTDDDGQLVLHAAVMERHGSAIAFLLRLIGLGSSLRRAAARLRAAAAGGIAASETPAANGKRQAAGDGGETGAATSQWIENLKAQAEELPSRQAATAPVGGGKAKSIAAKNPAAGKTRHIAGAPDRPNQAFDWTAKRRATPKRRFDPRDYSNEIILSLIAYASFVWIFGWDGALLIAPIILFHEYGHLFAYQMLGYTGNRLFLVPFFGGLAVAGQAHASEYERGFTAIMGPGICAPLSIALAMIATWLDTHWLWWWCAWAAYLCSFINALNLLPALPLDGGHIAESFTRSYAGGLASQIVLGLSVLSAVWLYIEGYSAFAFIILFSGLPSALNTARASYRLRPMNREETMKLSGLYLGTLAAHLGTFYYTITYLY
ncbi:MAG: hypothetical protein KDJ80_07590 [Nitratireductor sp.]|nr:hypothetical protein [Nitratireductor sp.]